MNPRSERREEWEANNESFSYDPPADPPEQWSSAEFTELYDRVIGRRVTWECRKCSEPCSSLEKARRHVANKHREDLLDSVAIDEPTDEDEQDPEPDTDDDQTTLGGGGA